MTIDIAQRLQQLVAGWRGAERGEPLTALHEACRTAAGIGARALLPAQLVAVDDLDASTLQTALSRLRGALRPGAFQFRVPTTSRFDAALVPAGPGGQAPDRWILAYEAMLPPDEQVALYGHALGHLLLERESQRMGQRPPLDATAGKAHADSLAQLREPELVRSTIDRRVLETYPLLTRLLGRQEEPPSGADSGLHDLRQLLGAAGWRGPYLESPYIFTDGRVYPAGASTRRGPRLQVDALLRVAASLPIAAVQTVRPGQSVEEAIRRLVEYARTRLHLPFAYLIDGAGTVHEFDWSASLDAAPLVRSRLPTRDELWNRWTTTLQLIDQAAMDALRYPYQLSGPKPRYYQETAINRALIAVLQARRNRGVRRILLTMATGTGKTKVAFQLVWKLKKARAIRNVLFLTDRDYLVGQAMDNDFAPFGDARARVQGEAVTSRDIVFATYQAIVGDEHRRALYRAYPRDFFDVVIVDECHRGSASEDSVWRQILEYYNTAVQIGLTATPLDTEAVDTAAYFGQPLYSYSLRAGINDGFLAPYRVRRILMGQAEPPDDEKRVQDVEGTATSPADLREHSDLIAEHLAAYLRRTDPLAKTIVFCVDQAHAEEMRVALERQMPEEVARYPGYVERIVADEGMDGRRALGRFSTPDERTPVIVTTSRLLATGVDVPTCKHIVLARPVGSLVEFKQIIGRGTRLYPPDKTWFVILDYAGATRLFFDPDFDGDPELVEIEPLVPTPLPDEQPAIAEEAETSDSMAPIGGEPHPVDGAQTPGGPDPIPRSDDSRLDSSYGRPDPATGTDGGTTPDELIATVLPVSTDDGGGDGASAAGDHQEGSSRINEHRTSQATMGQPLEDDGAGGEHHTAVDAGLIIERPTRDGRTIRIVGEILYELGSDGYTLRELSYSDYTRETLRDLVATPVELVARWLREEQRAEIRARLEHEGIDLEALATMLGKTEADSFDLLLQIAFGQPALTRRGRVERLKRTQAQFFERYGPLARDILNAVLDKYIAGEAPDISDTHVLRLPPLSDRGTFLELAQPFGGGANVRFALKELHRLLYTAHEPTG